MNYLLWGYYGHGNLGDDLMLSCLVDRIRDRDPLAVIHVRCLDDPAVDGIIPCPIDQRGRIPVLRTFMRLLRVCRLILASDVFIIGGGTLFLDKGRHNHSMLFLTIAVLFAGFLGRRVIVTGVGIDPIGHPANLFYLRRIFRAAERVRLRDDFSYTLGQYLSSGNVKRSADILFDRQFLNSIPSEERERDTVLLCFSDYFHTWTDDARRSRLIEQIRSLIVKLCDQPALGRVVTLCAFQQGTGERDLEFLTEIRNDLITDFPNLAGAIELRHVRNLEDVQDIFGRASACVGMRFHALVLSAIHGAPFIGINMEMKIRELCIEFGMPVSHVDDFLRDGIPTDVLESLLGQKIPRDALERQAALAEINFDWELP
jgi:polysaccharide pyruvyl transferase WcaK-like protein